MNLALRPRQLLQAFQPGEELLEVTQLAHRVEVHPNDLLKYLAQYSRHFRIEGREDQKLLYLRRATLAQYVEKHKALAPSPNSPAPKLLPKTPGSRRQKLWLSAFEPGEAELSTAALAARLNLREGPLAALLKAEGLLLHGLVSKLRLERKRFR